MLSRVWLLGVSACALGSVGAQAQDVPEAPVIVVTGQGLPRTPGSPAYDSQTIDRDRLLSVSSGRIEEALGTVAGFQQFRRSDSRSANPSAQGVTLRALGGNATSRALVLLDGVPMLDPFFGYVPLSAIAPERLARIRVTRGGGSGPFGAGALAGTIELESANATTLGPLNGSALVNDRGESELSGTLAARLGEGFTTLSGRWDRGQGFWTTTEAQRVPASVRAGFDSWSGQLRSVAPLAPEVTLEARLLAYRDARTLRFRGADTAMEGRDASVRLVSTGRWAVEALAYVQARDFSNVVISATRFTPTLNQRGTPATGLGGKIEVRPPVGGGHVVRLGADYRKASGRLFEDALSTITGQVTERRVAGGATSDLGFYLEDDFTSGALTLTAGARVDRTVIRDGHAETRNFQGIVTTATRFADRADWSASFRGGALVDFGAVSWRAAAYTGLRLPTLNELYRPFVVFPVTTLANAALRNERLEGFETGISWRPDDQVSVSLTAFDNRVRDAIANVTLGPNLRQRQNIDAIHARGIEAAAGAGFGQMRFDGSLAYTDARARGSGAAAALDGRRPAQTPRWAASGSVTWQPSAGSAVSMTLRHVGAQFEDDRETDLQPAATTLDAFARIALGHGLSLVLRGENLTNTEVITRNQAGSIDLGAPRTLWIGVRYGI